MGRRRRGAAGGRTILLLLLFVLMIVFFNHQIKPVVESETVNAAKIKSVGIINEIVIDELDKDAVTYENLVHVNRDSDGRVLSISADVVNMNRVKAKIIDKVQDRMNGTQNSSVNIPLGTLLGGDLFHGRGPCINLKLTLSGNVKAEFKSTFESAGINQTRHQIYLNVGISVYSFLPGFDATTEVETNVLVAETVIVGTVPEVVANTK